MTTDIIPTADQATSYVADYYSRCEGVSIISILPTSTILEGCAREVNAQVKYDDMLLPHRDVWAVWFEEGELYGEY